MAKKLACVLLTVLWSTALFVSIFLVTTFKIVELYFVIGLCILLAIFWLVSIFAEYWNDR